MSDQTIQVVTSPDGTPIEFLQLGSGPHVIVVPGALAVATDLTAFAEILADRYTVNIVQRRGRGGSGPQGDRYGIEREREDIEAVRARTGARLIVGHSFGGLVALRSACGNSAFDAIAVYEPGVSVDGSLPVDWVDQARREIAEGADFDAFVTFVRGINPDESGRVPRRLLRIILRLMIPRAELRQNLALMPQAISEHIEVGRFDAHLADYREITAPTLVLRGKGAATTKQALAYAQLADTIPHAELAALPGLDHFAPEKKPDQIAATILRFFAAHAQQTVSAEN